MKFSIRELLLVTVIVALAVGWWVDRQRLYALMERLHEQYAEEAMQEVKSLLELERQQDLEDLDNVPKPTVRLAPWGKSIISK